MKISFAVRAVGLACVLVVVTGLAAPLRAAQLASNINGTDLGFWGINLNFWSGVPFITDNRAWTVDNVVAPVSGGTPGGIFFQVYTNVAGKPGTPLGSKLVTPTISGSITNQTFTRTGAAALLDPSTQYWMVVGVDSGSSNPLFRQTNQTPGDGPGIMALTLWSSPDHGGTWSFQSAPNQTESLRMQINGTVPEPAVATAAASAAAALAHFGLFRRRPRASRLAPADVGA
jgi:hypothetical protein